MTTPWFPDDWPGWHYQDTLDATYADCHLITPDQWQWRLRERVPCPLCGAPQRGLCVSENGRPTFLVHTARYRLSGMESKHVD